LKSPETTPSGCLFSFSHIGQKLGQTLKTHGIYLRATYVNDILADVAGGNQPGTTGTGDTTFGVDLDMNTIAGIPNAALHVIFDDRTGLNVSNYVGIQFDLSGENAPSDTIRLSELSWNRSLFNDHMRRWWDASTRRRTSPPPISPAISPATLPARRPSPGT
jgi:carbohydrate-selective porin OprB